VEAELSVEEDAAAAESAPAEAELAVEESAAVETEAVTAAAEDESREDSEETVTAAANAQALQAPADRRPVLKSEPTSVPVTITAGANIQGVPAGSELHSLSEVADAMVKRLNKLGVTNPGADGEQITVATFSTSYPEERHLGAN